MPVIVIDLSLVLKIDRRHLRFGVCGFVVRWTSHSVQGCKLRIRSFLTDILRHSWSFAFTLYSIGEGGMLKLLVCTTTSPNTSWFTSSFLFDRIAMLIACEFADFRISGEGRFEIVSTKSSWVRWCRGSPNDGVLFSCTGKMA